MLGAYAAEELTYLCQVLGIRSLFTKGVSLLQGVGSGRKIALPGEQLRPQPLDLGQVGVVRWLIRLCKLIARLIVAPHGLCRPVFEEIQQTQVGQRQRHHLGVVLLTDVENLLKTGARLVVVRAGQGRAPRIKVVPGQAGPEVVRLYQGQHPHVGIQTALLFVEPQVKLPQAA